MVRASRDCVIPAPARGFKGPRGHLARLCGLFTFVEERRSGERVARKPCVYSLCHLNTKLVRGDTEKIDILVWPLVVALA